MARKIRARSFRFGLRLGPRLPRPGKLARLLLKSQLLTVFLVLCVAGVAVGLMTRPDRNAVPYDELFREMSVVSYRESPADTMARFAVDLGAGGRVFRRYEVDAAEFTAPPRAHDYHRAITGTVYPPLEVRGHVSQGLWLDVPRLTRPSLLPEQFDELYRATLDFVKPVSTVTGALGTLSGYSVGYRLGIWNTSLRSRGVQKRVLATPGFGPVIAREAWRRVLLEPLVAAADDDARRFAATAETQRVYTQFFRLALNDSDGFIPREAERLASLGRDYEARTMLAFAAAVRRAQIDAPVTSADFDAVERWASLLVRRGHWAAGAIPPAGEERARYLGTLAWYGVAPPAPGTQRIWVGSRLLVREGDTEGFVADEVPATGVGCPIAWRGELREPESRASGWTRTWFTDHPEFGALATLAGRVARDVAGNARRAAAHRASRTEPAASAGRALLPATVMPASAHPVTVVAAAADSSALRASGGAPADTLRAVTPVVLDSLHAPLPPPAPADSTRADSVRS